jgi:four helix bundle protein
MKEENVLIDKSYAFALRSVKLYMFLKKTHGQLTIFEQQLKAGTSIGANCEEAIGGQSRKDFIAKLSIAYKEARESHYWLRLFRDTELLESKLVESLLQDNQELKRILAAILKTSKESEEKGIKN